MAKLVVEKTGNYGIMFFNKYTTMNRKPAGHPGATVFKIFLTLIFILLVVIILTPFIAELKFVAAQRLAQKYLWKDAQQKFQTAMRIDPFEATIPAGFAEFLKDISVNGVDGYSLLVSSARLYKRALKLDPLNAEYASRLAEVEIALFIGSQSKDNKFLSEALDYARLALKNDPYGFNVSYSIGYAGISVWDKLNAQEKDMILDRLKYILKTKPWYSEYVYTHLFKTTKDTEPFRKLRPIETEQEKRKKIERIERLKNEHGRGFKSVEIDENLLLPHVWQGKSRDGDNIYESGNMYWTGTIAAIISIPERGGKLVIQAKGSLADDIWPYMIVELDGHEIGETFVNSAEWKEYEFKIDTSEGTIPSDSLKVLSVTFFNDGGNAQKNENRNLYIGEARIIKNE
jgi:tetratricopeptide (TPR) repeat protein